MKPTIDNTIEETTEKVSDILENPETNE